MAQVRDIATPNKKRVRFLECGDPTRSLDSRKRREFQKAQRLPAQATQRAFPHSAKGISRPLPAPGKRVDRGRNEESARFGDGFSEKSDQRVIDALIRDATRSEQKLRGVTKLSVSSCQTAQYPAKSCTLLHFLLVN
jgi:hypothetical protein